MLKLSRGEYSLNTNKSNNSETCTASPHLLFFRNCQSHRCVAVVSNRRLLSHCLDGFLLRETVESIRRFVNNTASPKSYQTHLPAMRFLGVFKSLFYMFYGYVLLGVTRSLRDCCVANWQLFVNLACLSWTLMHQCDITIPRFFPEQSPWRNF